MPVESEPLQNFNLDTMSGIYPGSRTLTYQRLHLRRDTDGAGQWVQLHWHTEPPAVMLLPVNTPAGEAEALLTVGEPNQDDFAARLHTALKEAGFVADACFACRFWQPQHHRTDDGLPAGRCMWHDADAGLPVALATQSALSLACANFERAPAPPPQPAPVVTDAAPSGMAQSTPLRVPKSAELDPDRLPFWPRLWHRLWHRAEKTKSGSQTWAAELIERSGVGAGTEPCFVCQGRLANIGAISVASTEGDKQTLSVWRCRRCFTLYLNDWTDRWERMENLETEERYYRIAPAEALAALRIIHATAGSEHPARRRERDAERAAILALVAGKRPLSHQIRQGR